MRASNLVLLLTLTACDDTNGVVRDASTDGRVPDVASIDAGPDASASDVQPSDTGADATAADAVPDMEPDAGADPCPADPEFVAGPRLSDPEERAFSPTVATRRGASLVAWHQAGGGTSQLVYVVLRGGCVGEVQVLDEPLANPKRASAASTTDGFVLGYQANNGEHDVVRAVWLSAEGDVLGAPETISASDRIAAVVSVAARGDDVAFTWTDSQTHYFARRGPVETVEAREVGTVLTTRGLIITPHIGIAADDSLLLVYTDGPRLDVRDVLLVERPVGGDFGPARNVSGTPDLLSSDVVVASLPSGDLEIVYVEQDADVVETFEVHYARRTADGDLTAPARFATQRSVAWQPSVAAGPVAAWHIGGISSGPLHVADGAEPEHVLPGTNGGFATVGIEPSGALLLAFVDTETPPGLRLARRAEQ